MAKITINVLTGFDDERLDYNLRHFDDSFRDKISAVVDYNAAWAVGYMKDHAPWHDNTGAARSGLMAIPYHGSNFEEILLAYSVYYGIWLEVAHDRKWAILVPTLRLLGDKLMKDLTLLIDRS